MSAQIRIVECEKRFYLDPNYQIKENCHVRFVQLPQDDKNPKRLEFPGHDSVGSFVEVKGNVVRMTQAKLLECKRDYICGRCKRITTVEAEYVQMFVIEPPKCCSNPEGTCKGLPYQKIAHPLPEHCIDFQEIRIQV